MPISRSRAASCRERGFSYLLLLFALVLGGVAMGGLAQDVQLQMQREREAELLFRGGEIRRAIESYHAVKVDRRVEFPRSLQDLLEDQRLPDVRHHLRRAYADPFTGRADWVLLIDVQGRLVGVHSRSRKVAMARHDLPVSLAPRADTGAQSAPSVGDWLFIAAGAQAHSTAASEGRFSGIP